MTESNDENDRDISRRPRRYFRGLPIAAGTLALIGAVWTGASVHEANERAESITVAVERNENLAVALEQFTVRTVQAADTLVRTLKVDAQRYGARGALEKLVSGDLVDGFHFQSAGIIDEFGTLVATTLSGKPGPETYGEREHFRAHARTDDGSLYVGKPVVSKLLGEPSIPFTRRINKPDGSFGGVAIVQISPSRFSEFYKSAKLDVDDFISVVGADGVIRVMRTGPTETFGEDHSRTQLFDEQARADAGSYIVPPSHDGMQRFVSYRTLRDYNLIVAVGTSEAGVLSSYRTQRIRDRFAVAAISVLLAIVGMTVILVSRRRRQIVSELLRVARHDPLTGLPNRDLFHRRFEKAIELARGGATEVSLLFLDLDNFKSVNDALGHGAGDALLRQTAERISGSISESDTLARLGGDEFGIVLVAPLSFENAVRLADHILGLLREPCHYEGSAISAKASIGVAGYPKHGGGIRDLMKDADIALYRAKAEGGNRVVVFTPDMRAAMEARRELLLDIRRGVESGEFVPYYQPKVSVRTGVVVGFEALARWQHPSRGLLMPGVFRLAFDDADLAEMLGRVMIQTVSRDVGAWVSADLECGRVAVNLSSSEFHDPQLAQTVIANWVGSGTPVERLEIEVTETVFLGSELGIVAETLREFRQAGVTVALDDFGTGFASLSHLKRFEVDNIKIDQSFVRGLLESPHDQAIVSAVIALGNSFQIGVTAEGVETEEQALRLTALGCDFAQGYLYAKPMAASGVPSFLESRSRIIRSVAA